MLGSDSCEPSQAGAGGWPGQRGGSCHWAGHWGLVPSAARGLAQWLSWGQVVSPRWGAVCLQRGPFLAAGGAAGGLPAMSAWLRGVMGQRAAGSPGQVKAGRVGPAWEPGGARLLAL